MSFIRHEEQPPNPTINNPMKKYIVALLTLTSVHILLADDIISPGQGASLQVSSAMNEEVSSMRVITQDEFDEKVPIVIHVNESLIIPIHYQRCILTNTPQVFFGPSQLAEIKVDVAGVTWSDDGMIVDLNLICTGMQVGSATVHFGEVGQVVKEFPMQIIE